MLALITKSDVTIDVPVYKNESKHDLYQSIGNYKLIMEN